jgi:prepilin-type N-terminal cleavage/methylation domain-containing protein
MHMGLRRDIHDQRGVTLIELLVGFAIFSSLTFLGATRVPSLIRSFTENNMRHEVEFDLRRARAEAASEGARVVFALRADGRGYTFGYDRLPYASPPAVEVVVAARNFGTNYTMTTSGTILFDSRGYLIDESQQLVSRTVELRYRNLAFAMGTIAPTGHIDF